MTYSTPDGPVPVQMSNSSHSFTENDSTPKPAAQPVLAPTDQPGSGLEANLGDRYAKQRKPINAAVHDAFGDADVPGIDQEDLISRITHQVIKQLQSTPGAFGLQTYQPSPVAPISPDTSSPTSLPPPASLRRDVYTPPSPYKATDFTGDSTGPASVDQDSPSRNQRASVPNSTTSDAQTDEITRPLPTSRTSLAEETTIEKIWGKLFDEKQMPTLKLSQLLRGTAVHLIECYEPKNSLVVTPQKLQQFYKDHPISQEPYPWEMIFDDEESHISRMYRELDCEHHLVQGEGDFQERPDIPGLTPRGFQHWATLLILAHPDEAFQRFQNVVQGLPISNPDDRKERFPKELPRKLFPKEPDWHIRQRLVRAIEQHAHLSIQTSGPTEAPRGSQTGNSGPPSPQQQQNQQPAASPPRSEASFASEGQRMPSTIERDRKPYSAQVPKECAIDDTKPLEGVQAPNPIERSRKPYSATPGQGRSFNEGELASAPLASSVPPITKSATNVPPPPPMSLHRRNSTASATRPINIPPPPTVREREYPPAGSSNGAGRRGSMPRRRHHSPPPASGFRASEGDLSGSFPGSYDPRYHPQYADNYIREPESRRFDHHYGQSPGMRPDRYMPGCEVDARRSSNFAPEDFYSRPRRETTGSRPI